MAECPGSTSKTVTVAEEATTSPTQQRLVLKLKKPKADKKVQWDESTVDNEFMGKKTSKCCCIYSKPRIFGESSSDSDSDNDDDDGCAHNAYCTGHKKKGRKGHHHNHSEKEVTPQEDSQPGASFGT